MAIGKKNDRICMALEVQILVANLELDQVRLQITFGRQATTLRRSNRLMKKYILVLLLLYWKDKIEERLLKINMTAN